MFQALAHGMGRLLAYFYSLIPNYGLAIILLTVVVRVLMIPLAIKQAHSMRANRGNAEKMRKLAPEVKKIREKYRDDRQRQYEEQKKLYDEHGVNMLGGLSGCLPLLLQAPVFLAMYSVLQGCDKLFGGTCVPGFHIPNDSPLHDAVVSNAESFLGTNLGSRPGEVFALAGFWATWPYLLLIAVMGATMWYQSQMMMRMQPAPDPQMAQTQKIMRFLPLMVVVFSWNFPAGLIVYWTASNLWTMGQQYVLLKKYGGADPADLPAKEAKAAEAPAKEKSPQNGKASGRDGGKGTGSRTSGGGGRAANGAVRRPAARGARAGSNGQPKTRAGDSDAQDAAEKPAGRHKGSGARKGSKGGRR